MNNELYHYGVIGMKWGIRRAAKTGGTYRYKSLDTKMYEKMASKTKNETKAKKIQTKAKRSADFDKKMEDSVRASSVGKTMASIYLNGVFGAKTYEAVKAAGGSSLVSVGATVASGYIAGPVGNMAATAIARQVYINRDPSKRNK